MQGYIDHRKVEWKNYQAVARKHIDDDTEDRPRVVGFLDNTEALVWPTPDATYTLKVQWWKGPVSWAFGTASPGSVTLNLPEDWGEAYLWFAAPALMVIGDPDEVLTNRHW